MKPILLCVQCSECGKVDRLRLNDAVVRLYGIGMLRRDADAEPAVVHELFTAALHRIPCADCGQLKLMLRRSAGFDAEEAAEWPDARLCEDCGAIISAERLEVLPDTNHCRACQMQNDQGRVPESDEFCPRCGDRLKIRAGGSGITRYRMTCPTCRR